MFGFGSASGTRAIPNCGPVSAAKVILEAHIRQLAVELAPAGITALCHPATYWMTGNTLHVDGGENVVG